MTDVSKTYLRYCRGQWGVVAWSVLLSFVQAASLVPIALIVQGVFDQALPAHDVFGLEWRVALIPILFAVNGAAVLLNRHVTLRAVKASVGSLRADLLEKAVYRDRERYVRLDASATHAHIVQDTERVDCMASAVLSQLVPGIAVSVALSVVLLRQSPGLFLLLLLALPLAYGVNVLVGAKVRSGVKTFHEDFAAFSKGALFVLQFGELVTSSTAEKTELERQRKNVEALRASSGKMAWLYTAYGVIQSNVIMVVAAAVLLVGGMQTLRGTMTVGALLSFYVNLNLLSTYLRGAYGAVPTIIEGKQSMIRLLPLLEGEPPRAVSSPFGGLRDGIVFENVGFRHPGSAFALRDVSFAVRKGELFGIFGASGSGKTTLIRLLAGMHAPERGRVLVDGVDLGTVDGSSYRKKIGVLFQHPMIFPGTIRENLTYGLGEVEEATLREVCRICRIDAHIGTLEDGFDADVGESGAALSGGQKQRLAIARALLREPELLILDEPDNNLDTGMVAEIIQEIRQRPMTMILISHDDRLVQLVDRHYRLV